LIKLDKITVFYQRVCYQIFHSRKQNENLEEDFFCSKLMPELLQNGTFCESISSPVTSSATAVASSPLAQLPTRSPTAKKLAKGGETAIVEHAFMAIPEV